MVLPHPPRRYRSARLARCGRLKGMAPRLARRARSQIGARGAGRPRAPGIRCAAGAVRLPRTPLHRAPCSPHARCAMDSPAGRVTRWGGSAFVDDGSALETQSSGCPPWSANRGPRTRRAASVRNTQSRAPPARPRRRRSRRPGVQHDHRHVGAAGRRVHVSRRAALTSCRLPSSSAAGLPMSGERKRRRSVPSIAESGSGRRELRHEGMRQASCSTSASPCAVMRSSRDRPAPFSITRSGSTMPRDARKLLITRRPQPAGRRAPGFLCGQRGAAGGRPYVARELVDEAYHLRRSTTRACRAVSHPPARAPCAGPPASVPPDCCQKVLNVPKANPAPRITRA